MAECKTYWFLASEYHCDQHGQTSWPLQDLADARVSLTGHAKSLPEDRQDAVKGLYKSKNPDSFWANFGDFKPFYMEDVVAVHFNGGFGRAGAKVSLQCWAYMLHALLLEKYHLSQIQIFTCQATYQAPLPKRGLWGTTWV